MITDFDIASDFKVELYVPESGLNAFIVGVSLLGGSSLLAADGFIIGESLLGSGATLGTPGGFQWEPIEAETSNAQFALGGSIESTFYFKPTAGTLSITLQSWQYDPSNNVSVRTGTPVRIRLDDGIIDQVLFNGFIDTFDVDYAPNEPNLINITAYDSYKRLVNARMASFDTTGLPAGYATPNEVFDEIASQTGFTISAASDTLLGKIPAVAETNVTTNQFIDDAIQVGLGIVWIDPETNEIVINSRPVVTTSAPPGTWTIGNNHGDDYHLCLSGIQVGGDIDNVTNSLYLDLASDSAVNTTLTNVDSIDIYGEFAENVTLNVTDLDELTRWGNAVFDQRPTKHVNTVTTPTIDRLGDLTAAAGFKPGDLIRVKYTTSNIDIDDFYTIIRVSHSVDVNQWYTTLELWKEY